MSAIPLHLQRKFEPRWATRFVPPVASAASISTDLKGIVNSLPRPAKAKPAELSRRLDQYRNWRRIAKIARNGHWPAERNANERIGLFKEGNHATEQ